MSSPSKRTRPDPLLPGMTSCIRLMHLMRVDLPDPEGPITAVTTFGLNFMLISARASLSPNQALRLCASTLLVIFEGTPGSSLPFLSVALVSEVSLSIASPPGGQPYEDVDAQDGEHQHEARAPRLSLPVLEG